MLPNRLYSLDLLRGMCALIVCVYHLLMWIKGVHIYNAGLYGVYMFFMLSGATMYYVYKGKLTTGKSYVTFFKVRFARILPLYAVVLLVNSISISVILSGPDKSLLLLPLNMLLSFGGGMPGITSLVTGGWSIGIEMFFYIIFPSLLFLISTFKLKGIYTFLFLSLMAQVIYVNFIVYSESLIFRKTS